MKVRSFYALISLCSFVILLPAGCKKDEPLAVTLPSVTTSSVTAITQTGAIAGGTVTSDGNAVVSQRGIVWDTNKEPKITLSTKSSDGTGLGSFTSALINLSPGTAYFARAYASNTTGTGYGSELAFTTSPPPPAPNAMEAYAYATSFIARWSGVRKVFYYQLDVSSDNFSTLLRGYNSLRVDTLIFYPTTPNTEVAIRVTGLNSETNYQYRVRVVMKTPEGTTVSSVNSNIVSTCTDPDVRGGSQVKNIDLARQLIVGTWELYSTSVTIPQYPFPDPYGNTERVSTFCKGNRPVYIFKSDLTVSITDPVSPDRTGTYQIDTAFTLLDGPGFPRQLQIRVPDGYVLLIDDSGASMDWVNAYRDGSFMYIHSSSRSFIKSK